MVDGVVRLAGSCEQILVGRNQHAQYVILDVAHGPSTRHQDHHLRPHPKLLV